MAWTVFLDAFCTSGVLRILEALLPAKLDSCTAADLSALGARMSPPRRSGLGMDATTISRFFAGTYDNRWGYPSMLLAMAARWGFDALPSGLRKPQLLAEDRIFTGTKGRRIPGVLSATKPCLEPRAAHPVHKYKGATLNRPACPSWWAGARCVPWLCRLQSCGRGLQAPAPRAGTSEPSESPGPSRQSYAGPATGRIRWSRSCP
jgi:hypothetical protein